MALSDLIEIVPLTAPVLAKITVPGSKSITNRALILAALADGEVTLKGALWSEDTQIMVDCLQDLGFMVNAEPDPDEPCNRTITVYGQGGAVPPGGTEAQPLDLFVGNAGTAARFLVPFLCLGSGVYRLHGIPRMHERPQAALFQALRELGYRVESENGYDKLPVKIYGARLVPSRSTDEGTTASKCSTGSGDSQVLRAGTARAPAKCRVSIAESSQFASALLLSAGVGGWQVEIVGENAEESPYVWMTTKLMEAFPKRGGTFQIEPDASSGSYFWAAGWIQPRGSIPVAGIGVLFSSHKREVFSQKMDEFSEDTGFVIVLNWPKSGWQIDDNFPLFHVMPKSYQISRLTHLGDSIMTRIVVTPLLRREIEFTDLGRLRVQECERVVALRTELTKCGAKVIEEGDTLTVWPSALHGAEIETYNDHRMAMCFAILGLKVPGIRIRNPACVKKTFPNFFQKLATQPPHGLGTEIWEIQNGQRTRKLAGKDLFAD